MPKHIKDMRAALYKAAEYYKKNYPDQARTPAAIKAFLYQIARCRCKTARRTMGQEESAEVVNFVKILVEEFTSD